MIIIIIVVVVVVVFISSLIKHRRVKFSAATSWWQHCAVSLFTINVKRRKTGFAGSVSVH